MDSYSRTIRYLYGLLKTGMKFGLRGIRALLRSIGNPHKNFASIHIAGSNGKGSTAAMLAAVLTAAGYKTGLYTSPHIIDFTERIRIDGKPIARKKVISLTRKLKPVVTRFNTTFFETVTAMAFLHFAEENVDIAVIETGLGGRLDATNVVKPLVSVITNIGLEHTEILGATIPQIAFEKAGIMKRSVSCVTAVQSKEALSVLRRVARKRNAPLILMNRVKKKIRSVSITGTRVNISIDKTLYKNLILSLPGIHQVENASIALKVIDQLNTETKYNVSVSAVREGLAHVRSLAGFQARLSVIHSKPLMIADVAHNPDAIATLTTSLKNLNIQSVVLVFGVSKDKDFVRMIHFLKPIVDRAIIVAAKTERARPIGDLRREFLNLGVWCEANENVREGIQRAREIVRPKQPIVITGSHFVVGEALAFLQKKKYLTINQ